MTRRCGSTARARGVDLAIRPQPRPRRDAARGAQGGRADLAIVNEIDSPLATEAEVLLPLTAGREQSVAATKSMIAGLVAGASLVAAWQRR